MRRSADVDIRGVSAEYREERRTKLYAVASDHANTAKKYEEWLENQRFEITTSAEFEVDGVDVVLFIQVSTGLTHLDHPYRLHIELKPSLADDYPAVLRQMRRNGSKLLVTREYLGVGATLEQVKSMFGSSGIIIAFVHEIEARVEKPA